MSDQDPQARRGAFLPYLLGGMTLIFFFFVMILITGGFFLYIVLVAAGLGGLGLVHYWWWGKALTRDLAGEMEEEDLRQRAAEQERPQPPATGRR